MMLRRALWLLIPLLLLGLLYASLPALASYVLTGWLESRGFEQPQLQLDHPGRNRLLIRHFSLGQQQPQRHLALTTDSIEVEYEPLTLLLEQRLTLIRIPRIELRVRQTGTALPDSAPFDLATVLPAAWLGLAPADRLQVGQLTLSYDSGGGPEPVLQGNFDLQQGQLISRLRLFSASRPLARLDLQLDGGNRFEARLIHDNAPLYQASGTLHRRDDELDIDIHQTVALGRARNWQQQWLPLALTLPGIEGELHSEGRLHLPLQLDLAATDWWRALSLEQQLGGELRLQAPVTGLERLALPLDGRLQLDNGHLHLQLPAGGELQLQGLELGAFGTSALTTRLASTLELDASLDDLPGSATLAPFTLELASARLRHPRGELLLGPASLHLQTVDMQQRTLSGAVAIERIEWQQPEQPLPVAALNSDFAFDGSTLENRFELRLDAPSLIAQGRARTRLAPLESDIHWQTRPLPLKQLEQLWNRYHPPAPPELTVTGGQLHLDGSANWTQDGLALRLEPHIEKLAARWRATRIEGGEWKGLALMRRSGRLEHQGRLSIPLLDIGFPVEAVEAAYDYLQAPQQSPQLRLERLEARLLGGRLDVDSVSINPLSPRLETRIRLERLELARLLELQQQPGLSGEGELSGVLPLRYDQAGLRVRDGRIGNAGPGRIRYTPDAGVAALGQSHQGMAMALQALQDFRYEILSVDLQYAPDGTTLMQTRLKGYNPGWNDGRPVDFNINIEQNLLKLLQALQFTGKLTDSIEQRYR